MREGNPVDVLLEVKVYAFREDGKFRAVCPDLSVYAEAATLDAAVRNLTDMIDDYVGWAVAQFGPEPARILRRASLRTRIDLRLRLLRLRVFDWVRRLMRQGNGPALTWEDEVPLYLSPLSV